MSGDQALEDLTCRVGICGTCGGWEWVSSCLCSPETVSQWTAETEGRGGKVVRTSYEGFTRMKNALCRCGQGEVPAP